MSAAISAAMADAAAMTLSTMRACLVLALAGVGCGAHVGDGAVSDGATTDGAVVGDGAAGDAPQGGPGSKRGVAYGFRSAADLAALGPSVTWWYNWADRPDAGPPDAAFIPMVWNGMFDVPTLDSHVPADAKYLLGFNEPNFVNQANLTPEEAAARWPDVEQFARSRGIKLVSPAVNYCGSPCNVADPFVWLQRFFAACPGCQVDYVGMHWYACDKPALVNTLAKYKQFGKPLWVTELACLDDSSKVNAAAELAYMKDAVAALEADPMVFRYAWFTGRSSDTPAISLLGADGKLTSLGAAYAAQPHH